MKAIASISERRCTRAIFAHEIGEEEGTPHIQWFVHMKNGMSRNAVRKMLGNRAHCKKAGGTDYEAWTYCKKGEQPKEEWDAEGITGRMYGVNVTIERTIGSEPSADGEPSDWEKICRMVHEGESNLDIIQKFPGIAIRCQAALDKMRLEVDRANADWRDLEVTFITGPTGCGKTSQVCQKYGYPNVYRATDKKHPFETYNGQDVIIFEEFRGGYKIEDMLNWLDGHPVELPARYANKMAKFTKVYLTTNIQFEELYWKMQEKHPETWEAFKRRVHKIVSHW